MEENEKEKKYEVEFIGEKYSNDLKTYKVIIIGDQGVGKSSIIYRTITGKFNGECAPTISLDIVNYQIKVNKVLIQIQFWDTCGNDEFVASTPNLFKNASLSIITYAINNRKSFENISSWNNILYKNSRECIIYLIGNKSELKEEREVRKEDGENLKDSYNFNHFFEISAKTGSNIEEFIKTIAISLYEIFEKDKNLEDNQRISLQQREIFKKKKNRKKEKCCH